MTPSYFPNSQINWWKKWFSTNISIKTLLKSIKSCANPDKITAHTAAHCSFTSHYSKIESHACVGYFQLWINTVWCLESLYGCRMVPIDPK